MPFSLVQLISPFSCHVPYSEVYGASFLHSRIKLPVLLKLLLDHLLIITNSCIYTFKWSICLASHLYL